MERNAIEVGYGLVDMDGRGTMLLLAWPVLGDWYWG